MAQAKLDLTAEAERAALAGACAWVLSDGKAGDEAQCLAVAEALGLVPAVRRVAPRAPFVWFMPWGPIDPGEAPSRSGSPVAPPFPDLVFASGRRAVPYLREIRRRSGGRSFTVFLKDPRTGASTADLIWAPTYDRVRGPNVVTTWTAPHRLSPDRLAAARRSPDPRIAEIPGVRAAVLVGGDSRHGRVTTDDIARFVAQLRSLAGEGVKLMITTSRRTPAALTRELASLVAREGGFLWDGSGDNPYLSMLALADAIVVTADSVNMVSEAVATGVPVLAFRPSRLGARHAALLGELTRHGAVRSFQGKLERFTYEKLDSTPMIAQAVARGFAAHRAALRAV